MATATIIEIGPQPAVPPATPSARFARVLLDDAGVQRIMGVGGIPLPPADAQAWLDARADTLFARAATEGSPYDLAANGSDRDQAKRLYDTPNWTAKLFRAVVLTIIDELNILRRQVVTVGTFTWDPANLADAAGVTRADVTATGAAFGDFVQVAAPYSLQGVTVTAYVHAANTIGVRLQNESGGAVNLANGTWNYVVWRPESMPQRTPAQARTAVRNKIDADA